MKDTLTHYTHSLSTQIHTISQAQRDVCNKIMTIIPRHQVPQQQTLQRYHETLCDLQENIEHYRDFLERNTPLQVKKEEQTDFDALNKKILILTQHIFDMQQVCGNMRIAPVPANIKNTFSQICMILGEIPETIEEIQEYPVVLECS